MRADDFLDEVPVPSNTKALPESSFMDRLYGIANKLFRENSAGDDSGPPAHIFKSSADAFLNGLSVAPKPKPEPSLTDRLYSKVNDLFREKDVMEKYDGSTPIDPHISQTVQKMRADPNSAVSIFANAKQIPFSESAIQRIRGPEPTIGSIITGLGTSFINGGRRLRGGLRLMSGDAFDSEYLREKGRREISFANFQDAVAQPEFESSTAQGFYDGVSDFLQQAPAIATAFVTRNPRLAAAVSGAPAVPQKYGEYRTADASPLKAGVGSVAYAATESLMDRLPPMGMLVKQLGRAGAGKFLTELLAKDVPAEQLTTLVQDALDTAIATPEKTWGEYLAERPGAAYQALIAMLTQKGMAGSANVLTNSR